MVQQFARFYDAGALGSRDETLKRSLATVNAVGASIRTEDGYRAMGHFIAALSAQENAFYELYLDVASLSGVEETDKGASALTRGPGPANLLDVFAELETNGQEPLESEFEPGHGGDLRPPGGADLDPRSQAIRGG